MGSVLITDVSSLLCVQQRISYVFTGKQENFLIKDRYFLHSYLDVKLYLFGADSL